MFVSNMLDNVDHYEISPESNSVQTAQKSFR